MMIRPEQEADYPEVFALNVEAFGGRDDESRLIERIRASEGYIPELSLVAEQDGRMVGHLLLSRAAIVDEDTQHEVIVLAPIAVKPDYQRTGIGSRLIREGLDRCRRMGYGLVLLIGHPEYYPRFGFKPARSHQIELRQFPVPDEVFLVCELQDGALGRVKGELKYPASFLGI